MSLFDRLRKKQTEKAVTALPPTPSHYIDIELLAAAATLPPADDEELLAKEMEYIRQQEARLARLRSRNAARILRAKE